MIPRRSWVIAGAVTLAAWTTLGAWSPDSACTIVPRPWLRGDSLVHFMATARPDTLFVRQFRRPPAAEADTTTRSAEAVGVYGQVARLDRISATLAAVLERDAGGLPPRVVLVRWGADSMCRRDIPEGSARWLEPNEQGFFAVPPIPAAQWVPGTPTFDVNFVDEASGRIYLPDAFDRELRPSWWRRLIRPRPMTIEEYRLFYEALPTWSEWQEDRSRAAESLLEWERAHRSIAAREPARSALEAMRNELQAPTP